jgi:hypothetical protein
MIGGISLVGVVTASLATWVIQRVSESEIETQAATPLTSTSCVTKFDNRDKSCGKAE